MALLKINRDPTVSQLRWFGSLWFPLFMAGVAALVWLRLDMPREALYIVGIGVVLGAVSAFVPRLAKVLWTSTMALTWPIGWVVSHLLLLLIFYGVMMPIGLVMRLFGKDPLHRRLDRDASSYWLESDPPADRRRYFRQF